MNRRNALALGATTALGALAAGAFRADLFAQTAAAPPPEAPRPPPPAAAVYGALPAISDAAISPDGRFIAMAVHVNNQSYTRIFDIDAGKMTITAGTQEGSSLRGVDWADTNLATFLLSRTLTRNDATPAGYQRIGPQRLFEYMRVGTLAVPGGQMRIMMNREETSQGSSYLAGLISPIEGDPGFGRMVAPADVTGERMAVYRVNLANGDGRPTYTVGDETWDIIVDRRGKPVARTTAKMNSNRWRLLALTDTLDSRLIASGESEIGTPPPLIGLLPDGRLVTSDWTDARDRNVLMAVNLSNGATELLFEAPKNDVDDAIADPWTHEIVGASWDEDGPRQHFFEPALETARAKLAEIFTTGYAELRSWSRDRKRMLVFAEREGDPGSYFVYEPEAGRLRRIETIYPQLPATGISGVHAITFAARDGVRIPAYLTLPVGLEPRNLPLVLLVHGGPHGVRDNWRFDWWSQFLASRGYMVLQPNYRGSGGYGDAWQEAGYREWGGKMQTDVEDGVAALIRSGRADPKRVCIMGASYGGYAALAGLTLTPDRYACAVAINGVADLPLMLSQAMSGAARGPRADYWQRSIGNRSEDAGRIRDASPAHQAEKAKAPVLIMHSTEDTVVPNEQSKIMVRRLREAGKPVDVVVLAGDDHWLSAAATRTKMLEEIEKFLARHLAAPPTP